MFWIGVDTGGTFTDLVVMDDSHDIRYFKSLSTPDTPGESVFNVLEIAAESHSLPLTEFLQRTKQFVHGTTIVTNAVISGSHAKTALLTNSGYEDMLMFGLGSKGKPPDEMFRTHQDYPEPIIPRYLTFGIDGRINAEGEVDTPLDEDQIRDTADEIRHRGVESAAISFLWSISNPAHEDRAAEILSELVPELHISIGHKISSVIREYERTSTCALDASIKPLFVEYLDRLVEKLEQNGYKGELLIVNSQGGVQNVEELTQFPVFALKSGPSLGPVAGLTISSQEDVGHNIIICDMGGTSFDASLVVDGNVQTTLMDQVGPFHYSFPTLDIQSIGAGGGSIAWVDSGGLVHVGPRSAGSSPGPACYMLGGKMPTVTDANVVLGYISPEYFMGGTMEISHEMAREAISEFVASPMGVSVEEAASLIYATVNQNMVLGLSQVTIQRGVDPRKSTLVAGGGCSSIHLVNIAAELGITRIIVPRVAPVLCAFGMLAADLSYETVHSAITTSDEFNFEEVNDVLHSLRESGEKFLARAGVEESDRSLAYSVMASYPYQSWEIEVPLPWENVEPENLETLVELFTSVHEQTYGFSVAEEPAQFVSWRARATGARQKPKLAEISQTDMSGTVPLPKGTRPAYFLDSRDFVETPIFEGSSLTAGSTVTGPAIVEEPATTIVIPSGATAEVTSLGSYLISMEE